MLVLALAIAAATSSVRAQESSPRAGTRLCEREMLKAARAHDVPVQVLYAIGLTETGRKDSLQPLAMNIEGRSYFARDLNDALAKFDTAWTAGRRLIDIGCMQINHRYHGSAFPSVVAMFDPVRNVDYAARFLMQLRAREGSWTMAVARYNAGPDNDPAQKRYVCAVLTNMVASGFGAWTPAASAFCR